MRRMQRLGVFGAVAIMVMVIASCNFTSYVVWYNDTPYSSSTPTTGWYNNGGQSCSTAMTDIGSAYRYTTTCTQPQKRDWQTTTYQPQHFYAFNQQHTNQYSCGGSCRYYTSCSETMGYADANETGFPADGNWYYWQAWTSAHLGHGCNGHNAGFIQHKEDMQIFLYQQTSSSTSGWSEYQNATSSSYYDVAKVYDSAPYVTLSSPATSSTTVGTSMTVTASGGDANASGGVTSLWFTYRLNGGAETTLVSAATAASRSVSVTLPSYGSYTICAYAQSVDNPSRNTGGVYGNASSCATSVTSAAPVTDTAPQVFLTVPSASATVYGTTVTLSGYGYDQDAAVGQTQLRFTSSLNGGAATTIVSAAMPTVDVTPWSVTKPAWASSVIGRTASATLAGYGTYTFCVMGSNVIASGWNSGPAQSDAQSCATVTVAAPPPIAMPT